MSGVKVYSGCRAEDSRYFKEPFLAKYGFSPNQCHSNIEKFQETGNRPLKYMYTYHTRSTGHPPPVYFWKLLVNPGGANVVRNDTL